MLKQIENMHPGRLYFRGCVVFLLLLPVGAAGSGNGPAGGDWAVVQKGNFAVELVESGDVEAVTQFLISAPMMWGSSLKVTDVVPEGTLV
ncbi:MAG: hypothetical protein JSV33_10705, partial [bacterium]